MKLNQDNVFEMQLWNDVFRSWLKDRGGPAYTEQARIVAGRQADLAVETMRERMLAPEQIPTHLTEPLGSFRQTSEADGRARERADVIDFMRHPPGYVAEHQRLFLAELISAIERGRHVGSASRLYEQGLGLGHFESTPEQAPARVTAERLHVAPAWVSSAAGIREAIDGAAGRGANIAVEICVDDENVAQWSLGVPEQAEALVSALLSVGVEL